MGQAKARGSKEQRIIEGEKRARDKEAARKKALVEREAAMTPEDKAKRERSRMLLAVMLAITPETLHMGKVLKMLS